MNAAFAMDSGGVDARVHADRLDSRIRNLTEASERQPIPFRVIGQSWTALREENGRIELLHLPGQVQRPQAPRLGASFADRTAMWIDTVSEQPNNPRALFYLGLILRLEGDTDGAVKAFDAALANHPTDSLRAQIEQFRTSTGE